MTTTFCVLYLISVSGHLFSALYLTSWCFLWPLLCSGDQFPATEGGIPLLGPEAYWYISHDGCAPKTDQLCGATPSSTRDTNCMRQTDPHLFYTLILFAVIMWRFYQQWLNEEKLAQRLIELIHPERDEEVEGHFSVFILMSNLFLWYKILS